MSTTEQQLGQEFSASEIVMLQLEIRELRDKVINLEQERINLILQNDNLKTQLESKK